MLIASRFLRTTRRPTSSHRCRPLTNFHVASGSAQSPTSGSIRRTSRQKTSLGNITNSIIVQIKDGLQKELRLQHIEGFIHKCLDKALVSTSHHQEIYEAVIGYLVKNMWAQPAASVYERMINKGFISSDAVDARMLIILLADIQGPPDLVLSRLVDIVSDPVFSSHEFLAILGVAEDYSVRSKFIVSLIRSFLRGKEKANYTPQSGVLAAWLRAAVKMGDFDVLYEIFEMGDWAIKLAAVEEAWQITEKMEDSLDKFGTRLVRAVANASTKEADLLCSLDKMAEVGMDCQVMARACESFLANRDASYMPSAKLLRAAVVAYIRADKLDQAFALLDRVGVRHRSVGQAFLATLRDTRPLDHHSFTKIISAMSDAGMSLDIDLYNVLISREVRLNRAANAFSMYDEMKQNPELLPDSYTFGSLFAMYRRIRPSSVRRYSAAARLASCTLPLRQLFQEFVRSTSRSKKPVQPNTALLNAALRAFMRQRDYAAAIVVIQSFARFNVALDHKSYYCVIKLIVRRIWAEVQGSRPQDQVRWVDRFLGVYHYTDIRLNATLVHGIFAAVRQKEFDLSAPFYVAMQARRHRVPYRHRIREEDAYYSLPTMQMTESIERPEPLDFVYEPVPLIRILSRAAFAGADVLPEDANRTVDELLCQAETEMLL